LRCPIVAGELVFEVDVLEEDAFLPLTSHLFSQAAHDQATHRIRHKGAIGLERHYPPQTLGCLAQKGRLVEPGVAESFYLAEYPLFQKSRIGTHYFMPSLRRVEGSLHTNYYGSRDHALHHPKECLAWLPAYADLIGWRVLSYRRFGSSSAQKYKISVIGSLPVLRYSQSS
jgi:hypothetical protein